MVYNEEAVWGRPFTIAVVVTFAVLTLVYAVIRILGPSDGTRIWLHQDDAALGAFSVTPLEMVPSDLLEDDIVVAIDGTPMVELINQAIYERQPLDWENATTLNYTVLRGSGGEVFPVTLQPFPWWGVLSKQVELFTTIGVVILNCSIVFATRSKWGLAQIMFVGSCSLLFFAISYYLGGDLSFLLSNPDAWFMYRALTFTQLMIIVSGGIHFALWFLRGRDTLAPWMKLVLYGLPYMVAPLFLWVTQQQDDARTWLQRWDQIQQLLLTLYGIAAIVIFISAYFFNERLRRDLPKDKLVQVTAFVIMFIFLGYIPSLLSGQPSFPRDDVPLLGAVILLALQYVTPVFRRAFADIVGKLTLSFQPPSLGLFRIFGVLFEYTAKIVLMLLAFRLFAAPGLFLAVAVTDGWSALRNLLAGREGDRRHHRDHLDQHVQVTSLLTHDIKPNINRIKAEAAASLQTIDNDADKVEALRQQLSQIIDIAEGISEVIEQNNSTVFRDTSISLRQQLKQHLDDADYVFEVNVRDLDNMLGNLTPAVEDCVYHVICVELDNINAQAQGVSKASIDFSQGLEGHKLNIFIQHSGQWPAQGTPEHYARMHNYDIITQRVRHYLNGGAEYIFREERRTLHITIPLYEAKK